MNESTQAGGQAKPDLRQDLGRQASQSLEKVMVFRSFFSIAAWTDFMMSFVCSMLMFQDFWIKMAAGNRKDTGIFSLDQ